MRASWRTAFDEGRGEPQAFIEAGECIIVPVHFRGRPRGSDEYVEVDETHAYRLSDGKIIEVREYRTKAEALAAMGMSE